MASIWRRRRWSVTRKSTRRRRAPPASAISSMLATSLGGSSEATNTNSGAATTAETQGLSLGAEGLEPITVRIHDKRGVVVVAVVLADSRLAVVARSGLERRVVKRVNRLAARRVKA